MLTEKILIVDDEQTVCNSVKKILSRKGYEVDDSLNVEEAIDKINKTSYDLVITDLMMPKTSGMELLEIVKENYPELDVIMITGYASIDSAVKATKLGASDYLPKPFTSNELTDITKKVLYKKKAHKEEIERVKDSKKEREVKDDNVQFYEELVDVDMPFKRSELEKRTSKEYVESLSHSDIPIVGKKKESPEMKYCFIGDRMCEKTTLGLKECVDECPIEKKEREIAERAQLPKEAVDVDIPYDIHNLEKFMTKDYIDCLDRSDIIRPALYGKNRIKKHSVLVIDDEPIVCHSVRKILNTQGCIVEEVCDAENALQKMKLNRYDLVLLDLKMPKKNGMELLKSIKTQYPDVPVIMITGYPSIEKAIEATRLGAFQFIPKPFTHNELIETVGKAF